MSKCTTESVWQKILQRKFQYDSKTGKLYHKNPSGKRAAFLLGKEVGSPVSKAGYLTTTILGSREFVHRIVWEMHYGYIGDNYQLDHIDGNVLNNRLNNLRRVSRQENAQNQKLRVDNKVGLPGVMWHKRDKVYRARIKVFYNDLFLGQSKDFFEACCLRKSAEVKYNFHPNHGRR